MDPPGWQLVDSPVALHLLQLPGDLLRLPGPVAQLAAAQRGRAAEAQRGDGAGGARLGLGQLLGGLGDLGSWPGYVCILDKSV